MQAPSFKCLVTGGAGFIGSHVVDILVNKGYSVVVVDNLSNGDQKFINPQAKFYQQDITQENLIDIFSAEQPDYVFHLAAHVKLRESLENPISDAATNILGTINVLECCRRANVKKIIYTSTAARVGEPQYLPVDENHPINPCSPYGISKHTAEHYVWLYNYLYQLDYLILCFGNVYGPRDNPDSTRVTSVFIDHLLRDQAPTINGDGEQTRDFIFVLDLADFLVDSLTKNPPHRLFHLANGQEISINEIYQILVSLTGSQLVAKHQPAITGEVKKIVLDTSLAQQELGWHPQHTIQQGLQETLQWFESHYDFH